MKRMRSYLFTTLFFLILLFSEVYAQSNLVINPDFEWFGATSDTFFSGKRGLSRRLELETRCFTPLETGFYFPAKSFHGKVYKSLVLRRGIDANEYGIENVQTTFCKALARDSLYRISFYIKPDKGNFLSKQISILFIDSPKAISLIRDRRDAHNTTKLRSISSKLVQLTNDKDKYQKIEFDYKAIGGERYLYLGNEPAMQDVDFIKSEYGGYNDPNKRQLVTYSIDMVSVVPYSKSEDCSGEVVWNNPYPYALQIGLQELDNAHIVLDTIGIDTEMNGNKTRWDFILGEIGKYAPEDTLEVRWHAFDSGEFGDLTMIGAQRAKEIFMFLRGRQKREILFEGRYVPLSITGDKRIKMFGTTEIIIRPLKRPDAAQPAAQPIVLDTIHYDTNLDVSGYKLDNMVSKLLEYNPADTVFVMGYTDSIGSVAYNQKLSLSRAQKVADFLKGKISNPLVVRGMGFTNPIDKRSNSAANRRTEIVVRANRRDD